MFSHDRSICVAAKLTKEVLQRLNEAWLKTYCTDEPSYNPLDILRTEDNIEFEKKLVWLLTQPDYFAFLVKYIFNIELLPFQIVILTELWKRKFPMLIATRGGGKSFLLGLYALMRCFILPNRQVIVAGAAFRQSRFVHEYMETIWKNAPIFRDLCDQDSGITRSTDMCRMTINGSTVTSIPIGTGEKIRGYRCQDLLAEEFGSHTQEIFETVLAGFGNVSSSPSEVVKSRASRKLAIKEGIDTALFSADKLGHVGNQIVICGTATYDFNHFSAYWKKYRQIIRSKGNQKELDRIFPEGIEKGFDHRYYSIIRLPYDALPEGFLDDGNVARSKASVHSGIFGMEFGAYFCKDSKGFFKRSMLEKCVANATNEIQIGESNIVYDALIKGNANKRYVIGVDPASEIDNFCIVVIELYEDHRRIVHCWTTTRESHKERVNLGLTTEDNFYSYCARRIRDLMRIFPTERIMMDSQGGGIAVSEALHETSNLAAGELPVWPIIDENKEKDTDDNVGLHLIEMVNFAKAEWTSEANHGMRKDFEDRVLLFPKFDPIVLGIAAERDALNNRLYDTLEDCVMEIEEMKNELVLIEITQTATGRDKWDTPEIKVTGNKKGKMRKDRYSALVMANMGARNISLVKAAEYMSYGGFAELGSVNSKMEPVEFIGPSWFTQNIRGVY